MIINENDWYDVTNDFLSSLFSHKFFGVLLHFTPNHIENEVKFARIDLRKRIDSIFMQ